MAHLESPHSALTPVFRRVGQLSAASPIEIESHTQQTSRQPSGSSQQSADNRTDTNACGPKEPSEHKPRLIIAIDFGTTYSTVSYAKIDPGVDSTEFPMSKICCIDEYEWAFGSPDARGNTRAGNVPTKLLYLGPEAPDSLRSESDPDANDDSLSDTEIQPISPPDHGSRRRGKRSRKSSVLSSRRKPKTTWSRAAGTTVRWGFSVQMLQESPYDLMEDHKKKAVELIKLTLGEDPNEDEGLRMKRANLAHQIEEMRKAGFIRDRDHLLLDYLTRLLKHAKRMLERDGLLEGAQLEYVLCVPVSWSANACRTMHDATMRAIQACKLGVLTQNLIPISSSFRSQKLQHST